MYMYMTCVYGVFSTLLSNFLQLIALVNRLGVRYAVSEHVCGGGREGGREKMKGEREREREREGGEREG